MKTRTGKRRDPVKEQFFRLCRARHNRKNYLFVGSDRGGRTAATLYSLVASGKRHQIDPFAYLKDVLERLPTHPPNALGELLPDAWLEAHPGARRRAAS
jgi:transposase